MSPHSWKPPAARRVNAVMTLTYWQIGRRLVEVEQGGQARAGYGTQLLQRLSADLSAQFGRGFSERNLEQMRLFYQAWPKSQTLSAISETVSRISAAEMFSLPWSHSVTPGGGGTAKSDRSTGSSTVGK